MFSWWNCTWRALRVHQDIQANLGACTRSARWIMRRARECRMLNWASRWCTVTDHLGSQAIGWICHCDNRKLAAHVRAPPKLDNMVGIRRLPHDKVGNPCGARYRFARVPKPTWRRRRLDGTEFAAQARARNLHAQYCDDARKPHCVACRC